MHLFRLASLVSAAVFALALIAAAAQEAVTLVVWDNFTREAEQAMIETLNARFEEINPGITVQRESYSTDDLGLLLPRELGQPTCPNAAMINQGLNKMAALVAGIPVMAAASLIVSAPVLVLYFFFQRSFIQGMIAGALKG